MNFQNLEFITNLQYLDPETIQNVNQFIYARGFGGITLPGVYLDYIDLEDNLPNIYLNLDGGQSLHPPVIRQTILERYIQLYEKIIKGFAFSPINKDVSNWTLSEIEKDFKHLNDAVNASSKNLSLRLILDTAKFSNFNDLNRISELYIQNGIKNIFFGSYNKSKFILDDTLMSISVLNKSYPHVTYGVFGPISRETCKKYKFFSDKNNRFMTYLQNIEDFT